MKAVILGAGDVGFHLAGRLSGEGEEITVIDIDQEKVDRVEDRLDVLALQGNGCGLHPGWKKPVSRMRKS